jgi:hypothetical protein
MGQCNVPSLGQRHGHTGLFPGAPGYGCTIEHEHVSSNRFAAFIASPVSAGVAEKVGLLRGTVVESMGVSVLEILDNVSGSLHVRLAWVHKKLQEHAGCIADVGSSGNGCVHQRSDNLLVQLNKRIWTPFSHVRRVQC